jgi:signal transduction histidine kinase
MGWLSTLVHGRPTGAADHGRVEGSPPHETWSNIGVIDHRAGHTDDVGARPNLRYRGEDRRAHPIEDAPALSEDRTWLLGGFGMAVLLAVLSWVAFDGDLTNLSLAVRSSSVVLAVVVAAVGTLYWRATGRAAGYLVGTAGWLIAVSTLAQLADGGEAAGWALLQATPLVLAAIWVGRAILGPTIDTRNSPRRQLAIALVSLTFTWGTATGLAAALDVPTGALVALTDVGAAAAWSAVAVVGIHRALQGTSILRAWSAWMAVCLALSAFAHLFAIVQGGDWAPIAGTLQLVGLLVAAVGTGVGLSRSAIMRREALFAASLRHEAERQRQHTDAREHDHEIRTALLAIEGATLTLERHRDRIDTDQREHLAAAVHAGLVHLRSLTQERRATPERPVLTLVGQRIALARSRGLAVTLHASGVPASAQADGRLLGQVVDNLLTNVERHACRSDDVSVDIEVAVVGDHVIVTVQDDGPGIPAEAYGRLFEPGYRLRRDVEGEGLGLPLARRLLRKRGGDLRAIPCVRGARFEARIPLAMRSGQITDEGEDGTEVVQTLGSSG